MRTEVAATDLKTLEAVQDRVLWLATSIVHHANRVRKARSGVKVGGHQASSASMVSVMSALWFDHLRAPDRVSVKPHASPVWHAIQYLLGRLDRHYLTELRAFGGLQSYPSRLKDPVPADFSTGSVGIGATAPVWSAVAHRYVAGHFEVPRGGRDIEALIAELDDAELARAIRDLGGHDLAELLAAFTEADAVTDRPSVIFAYTIKAWRLATEGHPGNHSALLTVDQWEELAADLGADPRDPWATFDPESPEAELCRRTAERLERPSVKLAPGPSVPPDL